MMKSLRLVVSSVALFLGTLLAMAEEATVATGQAPAPPKGAPAAEALGWHLGCQAYSFNRFTFYEAIDKVASLGLHYIEAYPGQRLSAENPDIRFDHHLGPELQQEAAVWLQAEPTAAGACGPLHRTNPLHLPSHSSPIAPPAQSGSPPG